MANPQLHPLEINPQTKEPFIRLRHHKSIILTPPRWEDAPCFVPMLNDPRVHEWLQHPPVPYTLKDGKEFLNLIIPPAEEVFQQLEEARNDPVPKVVGNCPFSTIREVQEDGTDVFIGNMGIDRCPLGELMDLNGVDWENKAKREQDNEALAVGDRRIIWTIGYYLAPSHHRQGIMTDAVDTLLHEWAIPRMGVRHMLVYVFTGNEGSAKVFLKNGFEMKYTSENHYEVKGKMRGLHVFERRFEY
ncbi:hypothetical protein B0H34DRAFT_682019 [Crassisporium funariophilum]|nr:hypothetical protein B0H34DRAFT_682019 [Crassisporium funariophilum]